MSSISLGKKLYYFPKPNRWQKGIGAELPQAYKKFWKEWKLQEPTAVHYVKEEGNYKFDEDLGVPVPIQNVPLPLLYPKEINEGIWGGEAIVPGLRQKPYARRPNNGPVAKFWVPRLMRSVVYSEVLNKYMRTIITRRTIDLIHANYGFDHYLLKTPACDLRSELAVSLKRNILIALADKTLYLDDPVKQDEIYEKYKEYLSAYTREEIEWYGLNYKQAINKFLQQKRDSEVIEPLKFKFRAELIHQLKIKTKTEQSMNDDTTALSVTKSWLNKVNPFSRDKKN